MKKLIHISICMILANFISITASFEIKSNEHLTGDKFAQSVDEFAVAIKNQDSSNPKIQYWFRIKESSPELSLRVRCVYDIGAGFNLFLFDHEFKYNYDHYKRKKPSQSIINIMAAQALHAAYERSYPIEVGLKNSDGNVTIITIVKKDTILPSTCSKLFKEQHEFECKRSGREKAEEIRYRLLHDFTTVENTFDENGRLKSPLLRQNQVDTRNFSLKPSEVEASDLRATAQPFIPGSTTISNLSASDLSATAKPFAPTTQNRTISPATSTFMAGRIGTSFEKRGKKKK